MKTLNQLFKTYCEDRELYGKAKALDQTKGFYNNNIKRKLGKKKVDEITEADVKAMFIKYTKDGHLSKANKVLTIMRAVLKKAKLQHIIEDIAKHKEFERERYLTPEELQRVIKVLDKKAETPMKRPGVNFIKLLLYTGARKSEIANATWGDLKGKYIVLKEHKTDNTNRDRKIFLNASAMSIINSLERKSDERKIIGIKDPKSLWQSVRDEAGVPDTVLHTLRHTFASYGLKSKKVSLVEIGNLLGHKSLQSTKRYSHFADETSIENAELVGEEIFKSIN